jgi:hypothetical protein
MLLRRCGHVMGILSFLSYKMGFLNIGVTLIQRYETGGAPI